jgi:putative oxidoreductase
MTTLARFLFAAVLLVYYWNSASLKLGDGVLGFLHPSDGAYIQIFPRVFEAAGYDVSKLGLYHWAFVTAGMWAEFLLPFLILVGLFTRAAALGMIGFVTLQSLTDLYGHGGIADPKVLGGWFDGAPGGMVLDQRAFWVFVLAYLVLRGGGPLALDRLIGRRGGAARAQPA